MKRFRTLQTVITTVLLVGVFLNGVGLYFVWSATRLPIIRETSPQYLSSPGAYYPKTSVDSDREYFQRELGRELSRYKTQEEKVLYVLRWTMSQFGRVESFSARSSQDLVQHGRSGRGAICGGMAQVFRDALISLGIPARTVQFQRNPFDLFDTHVSVEVWVGGKWRLFDPTFHIALRQGREYVGAVEARNSLLTGKGQKVEIVFLGEVKYPARIEENYLSFPFYFDNVYFNTNRTSDSLSRWPILSAARRWVNYYPSGNQNISNGSQEFYKMLFFLLVILFPIINLMTLVSAVFLYSTARWKWLPFGVKGIGRKAGARPLGATRRIRVAIAFQDLASRIRRIVGFSQL